MSLTGSRTLIRRSAEQWREILQLFEHSMSGVNYLCRSY